MSYCTNIGATYPLYVPRVIPTTIPSALLSGQTPFVMTKGYTTLSFTDPDTQYTFSFISSGGYGDSNTLATANSVMFPYPDTAIGCTVTPIGYVPNSSTNCVVQTPVADSGGRQYEIYFYVYPGIKPTIRLNSGTPPATELVIKSLDSVQQF